MAAAQEAMAAASKCLHGSDAIGEELFRRAARFKTKQHFLLKDGGNDVTEPKDITYLFNHAFVSIGENLVKKFQRQEIEVPT